MMFGIKRAIRASDALIARSPKAAGSLIGRAQRAGNPLFEGLGGLGRRKGNGMSNDLLRRSGRRRAMGIGAGAIVLNSRRTGNSTGGRGQVQPRTPGGYA